MNTVDFRRHLHSHPELSFEEHSTAAFISEQLDALAEKVKELSKRRRIVKEVDEDE